MIGIEGGLLVFFVVDAVLRVGIMIVLGFSSLEYGCSLRHLRVARTCESGQIMYTKSVNYNKIEPLTSLISASFS
jgi:hypothetical protein